MSSSGRPPESLHSISGSAQFHQSYASSSYSDETEKTIELELIGGRWLIVSEVVTPEPALPVPTVPKKIFKVEPEQGDGVRPMKVLPPSSQ